MLSNYAIIMANTSVIEWTGQSRELNSVDVMLDLRIY